MIPFFKRRRYALVVAERTFDLRWTGRYHLRFAEQKTPTVARTEPCKLSKVIVFASAFDRADELRKTVMKTPATSAFTIGHSFDGWYRTRAGSDFNKRSLTVHLPEIMDDHQVFSLGATLSEVFDQEAVLVSCTPQGEVYLVTPS